MFFWRTLPVVDFSSPLFDTLAAAVLHRSTKPIKPKNPIDSSFLSLVKMCLWKGEKRIDPPSATTPEPFLSSGAAAQGHGDTVGLVGPDASAISSTTSQERRRDIVSPWGAISSVHLEQLLRLVFINHWVTDRPVWLILLEKTRNWTTNQCYSTRTIQEQWPSFGCFFQILHSSIYFFAFLFIHF